MKQQDLQCIQQLSQWYFRQYFYNECNNTISEKEGMITMEMTLRWYGAKFDTVT